MELWACCALPISPTKSLNNENYIISSFCSFHILSQISLRKLNFPSKIMLSETLTPKFFSISTNKKYASAGSKAIFFPKILSSHTLLHFTRSLHNLSLNISISLSFISFLSTLISLYKLCFTIFFQTMRNELCHSCTIFSIRYIKYWYLLSKVFNH